mmetsp:Transcript_32847/g.102538  ORF Transcript_32847/g.102538 Transcript_32847/m.102538 type:complete len:266 (+) Transcript_32847:325-1122(+)
MLVRVPEEELLQDLELALGLTDAPLVLCARGPGLDLLAAVLLGAAQELRLAHLHVGLHALVVLRLRRDPVLQLHGFGAHGLQLPLCTLQGGPLQLCEALALGLQALLVLLCNVVAVLTHPLMLLGDVLLGLAPSVRLPLQDLLEPRELLLLPPLALLCPRLHTRHARVCAEVADAAERSATGWQSAFTQVTQVGCLSLLLCFPGKRPRQLWHLLRPLRRLRRVADPALGGERHRWAPEGQRCQCQPQNDIQDVVPGPRRQGAQEA